MHFRPIFLLFFCLVWSLPALSQGLKFAGLEQPIDKRTSYDVFNGDAPDFSGSVHMSFDMALYPESEIGYIFRIKNSSRNKVYNLFYDGQGDGSTIFMLNDEGYNCLIRAELHKSVLKELNWVGISVMFDTRRDSVFLTVADSTWSASVPGLPDKWRPEICFGRSDYIIDVPSFAIRNLVIGDRPRYEFPMEERAGTAVHDAKGRAVGKVSNPGWMMNDFFRWKKLSSISGTKVAASVYNPERKEVYYFNRDSLYIYNVKSGDFSSSAFVERCPVDMALGTCFLDAAKNSLYAYEVWYGDARGTATVARLDLKTLRWKVLSHEELPMQMHHHGCYFDYARGRYIIFGGFGNMHYNGHFYSFNLGTSQWEPFPDTHGDIICPRYFTSMGYDRNTSTLYVYGGMGNESGEQAVGRRYLYDLYSIDMASGEVSRLWTTDLHRGNVVPVRSMYMDGAGSFYTLCYPESISKSALSLYKFSLKDGSFETLADTIPIMSDKITTNANLYYDAGMEKLYALVYESPDDVSNSLSVYSLSLLPAKSGGAVKSGSFAGVCMRLAIYIAVCLAVAAAAALAMAFRRKRRLSQNSSHEDALESIGEVPDTAAPDPDVVTGPESVAVPDTGTESGSAAVPDAETEPGSVAVPDTETEPESVAVPDADSGHVPDPKPVPGRKPVSRPKASSRPKPVSGAADDKNLFRKNSINLFGSFTAISREGRNITSIFSPMQQKLLCVVLFYSQSGGIAPSRLSAILWPDRSGDSVKSLRNATLNHLRKSLSYLKDVNVVYKDGYYRIDTGHMFYCDYLRLKEIIESDTISDGMINELGDIMSTGGFMETMEDVSLDALKEKIGHSIVRFLPVVIKNLYEKKKYDDVILFSEALHKIDYFNDIALRYFVSALCCMKRTDEALLRYSTFIIEYRKAYGEEYKFRFTDLQNI